MIRVITYLVKNNNGSILGSFHHETEATDFFNKHVIARTLEKVTTETEVIHRKAVKLDEGLGLGDKVRKIMEEYE